MNNITEFNPEDFKKARVLVIGDVMLDRYYLGEASRISPEAPVPVVKFQKCMERAGGASNVAQNIAALCAQVTLIGLVGQDEAAESLQRILSEKNVICRLLSYASLQTIIKLRVLSHGQQLLRIDFEKFLQDYNKKQLFAAFKDELEDVDAVILSDYAKGTLSDSRILIDSAKQKGLPVIVDPKSSDFSVYRGASIISPNLKELEQAFATGCRQTNLKEKAAYLIKACELEALLVTCGKDGMSLFEQSGAVKILAAEKREVFDVTGAGDTVTALLGVCAAIGMSWRNAVFWANKAAGIVVGKLGVAVPSISELNDSKEDDKRFYGTVSKERLLQQIKIAKANGEKIIMTNGCFDILHHGHISYLEQAKRFGDRLVIAVNDDSSVRRLKGDSRPVNNIANRMKVLAGLQSVDWVVPFCTEEELANLICDVCPKALVKGEDYSDWPVEKITGAAKLVELGGEIKFAKFVNGCSTTKTIEKIKR